MSQSFIRSLAFVCVVVVAFVAAHRSSDNKGRSIAPLNIVTLNIEAVIDDYLNDSGELETLVNAKKVRQRALQGIQEAVESLEGESNVYPKNSEEYYKLRTQAQTKRYELQIQAKSYESYYNVREGQLIKEVYDKAMLVVQAYCEEKGIDMALLSTPGEIPGSSRPAASSAVLLRGVIFSGGATDITDDIKERLKK